ncbi:hypothetical protein HA466_0219340 [Hirschfeldia incana]|nr:hypothetical protein HA466_0219340 [Hirschfeldia incana]
MLPKYLRRRTSDETGRGSGGVTEHTRRRWWWRDESEEPQMLCVSDQHQWLPDQIESSLQMKPLRVVNHSDSPLQMEPVRLVVVPLNRSRWRSRWQNRRR